MNAEHFKTVERLFDAACKLAPAQRPAFLREQCVDDTTVRRQVEALLDRDDEPHALLDANASELGASVDGEAFEPPPIPDKIGPYRILGVLGQGGMGVVYRARQEDPARDVALKVLRPGLHSHRLIRRFRQESTVLAQLQHPGIAQVYEAGSEDTGHGAQPYFAMELVEGLSILKYATKHELSTRARVELLINICEAIQHAHQRGVIHRDLKPANILIKERDGVNQPKVLDFGIARAMGPDFQTTTLCTEVGQLVGTLPYMSPEQAAGKPDELDTRTDVYALGALGYELLSGKLPLDIRELTLPEAVRAIQEDDPTPLATVSRVYHGDLDTIIGKAIEKDKTRRYASASELAVDLRRFLNDEPIIARPPSAMYQLRKFTKRNKSMVIAACLLLAILVAGVAVSTTLYLRSEARAEALRRSNYAQNISLAQNALEAHEIGRMQSLLEACPSDLRGWEWQRLRYLSDNSIRTLRGHTSSIFSLDFSPDGSRLVSGAAYPPNWPLATRDRSVRVWNVESGEELMVMRGHRASVNAVAYSPDGAIIASGGGTHIAARDVKDVSLRFWNAVSGELIREFPSSTDVISHVHVDATGRIFVSANVTPPFAEIRRYDATMSQLEMAYTGIQFYITNFEVSRDESLIAASGWDDSVHVWEVETGREIFAYHHAGDQRNPMIDVALSPDGRLVAAACTDHLARVWDIASGDAVSTLRGHEGVVRRIAFLRDGVSIVTAGSDQTVRVWNAETGAPAYVLRGASDVLMSLAVSPDGKYIAAAGNDTNVRIWETRPIVDTVVLTDHSQMINEIDWTPDGSMFLSASDDGRIGVWDASTATLSHWLEGHTNMVYDIDISKDGTRLASSDRGGIVKVWDMASSEVISSIKAHPTVVPGVAWHPSARLLATCGELDPTKIWDMQTGELALEFETGEWGDRVLAFSPDGSRLYGAGWEGILREWNAKTGELVARVTIGDLWVTGMDLSPDGQRIAVSDAPGFITVLDRATLNVQLRFHAFNLEGESVEFSPDGSRLVTTGRDMRIKIFDSHTGEHLLTLRGHDNTAASATFDPSGRTLVSGGADATIRIWPTER